MKASLMAFWKVLPLKVWVMLLVGAIVMLGLVVVFKSMHFLVGYYVVAVMSIVTAVRNRAKIWREGDQILFRPSFHGAERKKPVTSQVEVLIEWEGYEGILCDVVWKDGEVWTLPGGGGALARIATTLKECGMGEVPTRKDWRVYRPEWDEQKNGQQSG